MIHGEVRSISFTAGGMCTRAAPVGLFENVIRLTKTTTNDAATIAE
jgi:hypothetical protein